MRWMKEAFVFGVIGLVIVLAACGSGASTNMCEQAALVVADCTGTEPAAAPANCSGEVQEQSARIVEKGCSAVASNQGKADNGDWGMFCKPDFDWLGMCEFVSQGEDSREYVQKMREFLPGGYYYGTETNGEDCTVAVHIPNFMGALDWSVNAYRPIDEKVDGTLHYHEPLYVYNLSTLDSHRLMEFELSQNELNASTRVTRDKKIEYAPHLAFEFIHAVKHDGKMTVTLPGFDSWSEPLDITMSCTFDYPEESSE